MRPGDECTLRLGFWARQHWQQPFLRTVLERYQLMVFVNGNACCIAGMFLGGLVNEKLDLKTP